MQQSLKRGQNTPISHTNPFSQITFHTLPSRRSIHQNNMPCRFFDCQTPKLPSFIHLTHQHKPTHHIIKYSVEHLLLKPTSTTSSSSSSPFPPSSFSRRFFPPSPTLSPFNLSDKGVSSMLVEGTSEPPSLPTADLSQSEPLRRRAPVVPLYLAGSRALLFSTVSPLSLGKV